MSLSFSLIADDKDQEQVIKQLIEKVKHSGATFIRNGDNHSSEEAAEHLSGKWRRARAFLWFKTRQSEFTPEQFITHIASKSSLSGKPYQIKLKNGTTVSTEKWLRNRLKELEKHNGEKKQQKTN